MKKIVFFCVFYYSYLLKSPKFNVTSPEYDLNITNNFTSNQSDISISENASLVEDLNQDNESELLKKLDDEIEEYEQRLYDQLSNIKLASKLVESQSESNNKSLDKLVHSSFESEKDLRKKIVYYFFGIENENSQIPEKAQGKDDENKRKLLYISLVNYVNDYIERNRKYILNNESKLKIKTHPSLLSYNDFKMKFLVSFKKSIENEFLYTVNDEDIFNYDLYNEVISKLRENMC